jgi:hypothetical protein
MVLAFLLVVGLSHRPIVTKQWHTPAAARAKRY